jgi:hypothetical protein
MTETAVPILPSRDLAETLAFYERLGFRHSAVRGPQRSMAQGPEPLAGRRLRAMPGCDAAFA